MKKLLIVNNNMKIGGVQKSLCNLLWEICDLYDITLCLFSAKGALLDAIPPNVTVKECGGVFRLLGISQDECRGVTRYFRAVLVILCRLLGRATTVKLMSVIQPKDSAVYDCAVAYLQNGRKRAFYGGVQEYVLGSVHAERKAALIHCDWEHSDANYGANRRLLERFDAVAACSDSCREIIARSVPAIEDRLYTVRNCHNYGQICKESKQNTVTYDTAYGNMLMVARLAHEKGIDRAIDALAAIVSEGIPAKLHIVGEGPMEQSLRAKAKSLGIAENVVFYGEQSNPYRFMPNADLLLITSCHEAAPMVINEAASLGLPVLSVRTSSAEEMISDAGLGWVCDNEMPGLIRKLKNVMETEPGLRVHAMHEVKHYNNNCAKKQFITLTEAVENERIYGSD